MSIMLLVKKKLDKFDTNVLDKFDCNLNNVNFKKNYL